MIGDKHSVVGRNYDREIVIKPPVLKPATKVLDQFIRFIAGAQILTRVGSIGVADKIGLANIDDK